VITAASLLPVGGAQAMTPGTASGAHAAIAQTSPIENLLCPDTCLILAHGANIATVV